MYSWWTTPSWLKNRQHGLDIAPTLPRLLLIWRLPLGRLGFCFRVIAIGPWLTSSYDIFGEIWVLVRGSSKSCVTSVWNSFCSCDRSCGTNFAATFLAKILHKNLWNKSVESPGLLLILALSIADFHQLQLGCIQHFWVFCLLKACQKVDGYQEIHSHLWSIVTIILSGLHSLNHPQRTS